MYNRTMGETCCTFGLSDKVAAFIVDKARELDMREVVLFGSRARGDYSDKSDIDLAISGDDIHAYQELLEDHCPTLLMFDFIDLSKEISPSLRSKITSEGVLLYG